MEIFWLLWSWRKDGPDKNQKGIKNVEPSKYIMTRWCITSALSIGTELNLYTITQNAFETDLMPEWQKIQTKRSAYKC